MDPKTLFSLSRLRPFEGLALTSQDLLDDPPTTGVPAPASALLLAAALVTLLRRRRA